MSNPKCLDQSHLDIQFKNKYFFQLLNSSLLNLCIIDDIISRATHKQNSSELIISIVKFIDIFRWQSLTSAQECKEIFNFPVTVINSWKQKINSSPFAKCLPQICNYSMLLFRETMFGLSPKYEMSSVWPLEPGWSLQNLGKSLLLMMMGR